MIDEIELPRVSAELAELHAVFDSAVADLEEWQRDEAADTLGALRGTLAGLVGHADTAHVQRMIGVFAPSDEIGIEEAAELVKRTPNRIRQLCRKGIGRFDLGDTNRACAVAGWTCCMSRM
jgi:hypothetical protein